MVREGAPKGFAVKERQFLQESGGGAVESV
jgi:hypothetical protein